MSDLTDLLDEIQDRADRAQRKPFHPAALDNERLVAALRAVLRQADALDELAESPIGSVHAGALSLGARSIRHAITKALEVEP